MQVAVRVVLVLCLWRGAFAGSAGFGDTALAGNAASPMSAASAVTHSRPPALTQAPRGHEKSPGPWSDPEDLAAWPNTVSNANSDPWLAANHDRLRVMRPRVLVINFSNQQTLQQIDGLVKRIIEGLAEGSRWHGYADPQAPAFLQYQVFKTVDLRDKSPGDSLLMPAKPPTKEDKSLRFRYAALFDDAFAARYAVPDPDHAGRFLKLGDLVDRGIVHEVWVVVSGGHSQQKRVVGMWESIELKQVYDEKFAPIAGKREHCGNGDDPEQPWIGRSLQIGCINASRGPGCFLESLSHSLEQMGQSSTIPYLRPYFIEYGGFDLDKRYKTPFDSFYAADMKKAEIAYPDPKTAVVPHKGKTIRIENYVAAGGNVHFPPNGRRDYDQENTAPVMSTIEDWRMGSGPGGKDVAKPWTVAVFGPYRERFGDCMGPWLVYWRQNMPGLDNRAKDDQGKPMKNWWPFLFY